MSSSLRHRPPLQPAHNLAVLSLTSPADTLQHASTLLLWPHLPRSPRTATCAALTVSSTTSGHVLVLKQPSRGATQRYRASSVVLLMPRPLLSQPRPLSQRLPQSLLRRPLLRRLSSPPRPAHPSCRLPLSSLVSSPTPPRYQHLRRLALGLAGLLPRRPSHGEPRSRGTLRSHHQLPFQLARRLVAISRYKVEVRHYLLHFSVQRLFPRLIPQDCIA